jgi:hypothetical protein
MLVVSIFFFFFFLDDLTVSLILINLQKIGIECKKYLSPLLEFLLKFGHPIGFHNIWYSFPFLRIMSLVAISDKTPHASSILRPIHCMAMITSYYLRIYH